MKKQKEREYITLNEEERDDDYDFDSTDLMNDDDLDEYFDGGECSDPDGRKVLLYLIASVAIVGAVIAIIGIGISKITRGNT
jgi:hypothetical protein